MLKGINIFKKKGKSFKEIHESEVYTDPSVQHGVVRRVNHDGPEEDEESFYADPRTRPRIRPSVLTTSNTGYSEMTTHSERYTTHTPDTPNPAHNPNYMFQDPYEIPIQVSQVQSAAGTSPPILVNYNSEPPVLPQPYMNDEPATQPYMNEPANREVVCEADSDGSDSEPEEQNIHSTTKNGLYQNIETVEVKQGFDQSLFGGYEDIWQSGSVKQSLYTNIDTGEHRSNPELDKVGMAPVKPARRATTSQLEKPKLSVKYQTPPLPASRRPQSLYSPSSTSYKLLETDENTPPQIKSRAEGVEERRVEVCSSEEIQATSDLDILQQRWYFGTFTRLRAEVRLNNAPSSTFLVRVSTNDNSFILSLKLTSGSVAHIKILTTDSGVSLVGSNRTFPTVPEMIANYTKTPIAIRQLGLQQILNCGLISKS